MHKKRIMPILIIVLALAIFTACGAKEADEQTTNIEQSIDKTAQDTITPSEKPEPTSNTNATTQTEVKLLACGECYTDGDLSFNILSVKENITNDSERLLLVKMEVFNIGNNDISFSSLMSLELTDEHGDNNYSISPFARTDGNLDGTIFPKNKIIGEVAFEIEDSKDNVFVLHIGQNFELKPAYQITEYDLGTSFEEMFESEGIVSEYTVGVPLETENLTILLKDVSSEESKKEGLDLLLCEIEVTNKGTESQDLMLGFNYDVFSADGMNLDMYAGMFDLPVTIEGNSSVSGIASFYFEKGKKDFYMTITPNLSSLGQKETIVFSLELEQQTSTDQRKLLKYEDQASEDLLVPNYPHDILPLYQASKVIDSIYDYRGGTGQTSQHTITAELILPSNSFDSAVEFYDGFGLEKEILTTNNGNTEEATFTGEIGEYTIEVSILRFLIGDGDPLVSVKINY